MKENTKKRELTKNRLKDALMKLYIQYDYSSITITMLCNEAHLHRSTFYFYYNSVDEVLREIEQGILAEIQSFSDRMNYFDVSDSKLTPGEAFRKNEKYMVEFYEWQYSIREYLNPLLGAYGDPYFIQHYEKIITDNVIPALDFLEYDYKDNPYVLKYITGGVVKTNQDWLLNGDISIEELVKMQRTMLFDNPLFKR